MKLKILSQRETTIYGDNHKSHPGKYSRFNAQIMSLFDRLFSTQSNGISIWFLTWAEIPWWRLLVFSKVVAELFCLSRLLEQKSSLADPGLKKMEISSQRRRHRGGCRSCCGRWCWWLAVRDTAVWNRGTVRSKGRKGRKEKSRHCQGDIFWVDIARAASFELALWGQHLLDVTNITANIYYCPYIIHIGKPWSLVSLKKSTCNSCAAFHTIVNQMVKWKSLLCEEMLKQLGHSFVVYGLACGGDARTALCGAENLRKNLQSCFLQTPRAGRSATLLFAQHSLVW